MKYGIWILSFVLFIVGCSTENDSGTVKTEPVNKKEEKDTNYSVEPILFSVKNYKQLTDAKGIIGIYDVPETLTLLKADSAEMKDVAKKLANAYRLLQQDMEYIGAQSDGAAGAIYYTNDPKNFVFECIMPIREIPKKQPRHSKVVVLEASHMLIYNYYGPYQNLFNAYAYLKSYMAKNKLQQSGPMREFYISDPTVEKDSTQWLTRILVPVKL